jgi:hypothetical protein
VARVAVLCTPTPLLMTPLRLAVVGSAVSTVLVPRQIGLLSLHF